MKTPIKLIAAGGLLSIAAACAVNPPPPNTGAQGYYGNDRYPDRAPGQYADNRYPNDPYNRGGYDYNRTPVGPDPFYQSNLQQQRIWDEVERRYYYIDPQTTYSYWHNGEFRSR